MCGRFTLRRPQLLPLGLRAQPDPEFEEFSEHPRFNVAPSQHLPIVRINKEGQRVLSIAEWGLIPSWTKAKPKSKPINARAETVATSGMFRQALNRRRCLVPADGFYEWRGQTPPKQPYFIRMKDDQPFTFAGLWERWKSDPAAEPVDTFTILTTTPNELMEPIHNRMPVIVRQEDRTRWLDRDVAAVDVLDMLRPFDAALMEAYPISAKVNNVRNEGPELIEPE